MFFIFFSTFVAYADSVGEVLGAVIHAVVSLFFVTVVWLVVAPVFGVQLSPLKKSSADLYETYYDESGYSGSGQSSYPYGGSYYGDYSESRSLQGGVMRAARAVFNR